MELKSLSSNWKRLQQTLQQSSPATSQKRKSNDSARHESVKRRRTPSSAITTSKGGKAETRERTVKRRKMSTSATSDVVHEVKEKLAATSIVEVKAETPAAKPNEGLSSAAEIGKYLAVDCEMVGVGPNPDHDSALARVSIVNYNGDQVYDSFVRPKEMVTDWRTHVSGVSAKHMIDARSFEVVQRDVAKIIDGCVLIGHAIRNDFDALLLSHPKRDIRDTSRHPPYRKFSGGGSPRLKVLASEILGLEIQEAAHSSIEDARATMLLYRRDKVNFEREHAKKWPVRVAPEENMEGDGDAKKMRKSKKKKGRK
ncbi:hypothetical protein AJ80_01426 [Polytolypa hystricis UAMH7299]|uniref:RNA exonuclease 4 n=1 Tax=Polytolypa hystricis (strain UAMH7299) TaxID=1447883 RepID=A0A2B7YZS4_POLH7|nr:hypothetical protein AJ80_01426 [Polytolypa hystricis UAMH7299]